VNAAPEVTLERRLLILAPVGRDAMLIQSMLRGPGIMCAAVANIDALLRELQRGAAAIVVAEEALAEDDDRLAQSIALQPPWSDLPVLLLTRTGADSAAAKRAVDTLGNVTLLERPVRIAALASAVRSALRARERQYQTRAHLLEREESDRRKDEFLAMLAHELRNPLAPIRNAVDQLRLSSPERLDVWQMMDRQVSQVVRLVDDLMEVSRITRGSIDLRKEVVELAAVIEAAVETSRPQIDSSAHRFTLTLPPVPLFVEADPVRLAQVFSNLLNNAARYTDPGGRIHLEARREDGRAVVCVRDSGIGIPAGELSRVFDMFAQADARDRRSQGGLGIGLTLARRLVEMHGGSVTAASAGRGLGSEFVVRLPLTDRRPRCEERGMAPEQDLHGLPRVLVVDDNRDAADSLGALLGMLGAEVTVTHDGRTALEAFATFRPAALFIDLDMPGMDGFEVASRVRALPGNGNPVLVALTGLGRKKDRRRTEATGFDLHLVKPADIDDLQTVLASLRADGDRSTRASSARPTR